MSPNSKTEVTKSNGSIPAVAVAFYQARRMRQSKTLASKMPSHGLTTLQDEFDDPLEESIFDEGLPNAPNQLSPSKDACTTVKIVTHNRSLNTRGRAGAGQGALLSAVNPISKQACERCGSTNSKQNNRYNQTFGGQINSSQS